MPRTWWSPLLLSIHPFQDTVLLCVCPHPPPPHFPPVKPALCKPICLNPCACLALLIPECSRRAMQLPEFLHGRPRQVRFKQFLQECLEAESVLLAAQERRNTSNIDPSKKSNFSPSQSNLDNVGQESYVLYFLCSLNPTACYSQYFCYSSC